MSRRLASFVTFAAVAVTLTALGVTLASCGGTTPPPDPTIGQTWQAPGNEDLCFWDGQRWAEVDDREDCTWELDGGHSTKRRTVTVAPPTRATTVRSSTSARRTSTTRTTRATAPTRPAAPTRSNR